MELQRNALDPTSLRVHDGQPRASRSCARWDELVQSAVKVVTDAGLLQSRSFVGGEWVAGDGQYWPIGDPATGASIHSTTWADAGLIDTAVDAARSAQAAWSDRLPVQRATVLRKWAQAMRAEVEPLALLITLEQGKPLHEAAAEVQYSAGFLDWFAGEAERAYGETIPSHKPDSRLTVDMQPVGVVGIVTPWNFPSAMIVRKAAAAIAAGCSVVVKPAPETPLSALALAQLAVRAGVPPGVFNVVHGDAVALTTRLVGNRHVRALSFTGSTEVGRILMAQAAPTVKRLSMELGGHAPFVVFDDAGMDAAVSGCIAAKFATSGQDCLAANRVYVQRPIYAAFCESLAKEVARLKVGHGLENEVDIGPMTRIGVVNKCYAQIADAVSGGARCLVGGEKSDDGPNFVVPTLLVDVTDEMLIAREETFGPVVAVLPFDDEDEVTARANASEMGLAAYVYTQSLNRATRMSRRLEYGMVAINTASFTGSPIPFGGWKQSGLGREGSRHGMAEFMELKYTCVGGLAA